MRSLRLAALTLVAVFAGAGVAQAAVYEIPKVLRAELREFAPKTNVPIRLPARMNLDYGGSVFAAGGLIRGGYQFNVDAAKDCGANVCFLAQFSAERGAEPVFTKKVRLANGITGYYKPLSCGGSCSPPMIEWVQKRVLYSIQAKVGVSGRARQRGAMVRAANSAIRSAPR